MNKNFENQVIDILKEISSSLYETDIRAIKRENIERKISVLEEYLKNKVVKFRFHRPTLDESLETQIEIRTKQELYEIISERYHNINFSINDLKIEFYTYDQRINWNTYIVHSDAIGVAGFTNGPLY